MKINGREIARTILNNLKEDVENLKTKGITPTLAVILIGNDPESASYVRQKDKAAHAIGAELRIKNYELGITKEVIQGEIDKLNNDPSVHGIIIQRPVPTHLQDTDLLNRITPKKDVDGFVPDSQFEVPIALALIKILEKIH